MSPPSPPPPALRPPRPSSPRSARPRLAAVLCLAFFLAACAPERPVEDGGAPAAEEATSDEAEVPGPSRPESPAPAPSPEVPPPTGEAATADDPALQVHAWNCDNGMYVVTEHHPDRDELILQLPRGPLTLTPREAASGARWSDGTVVFWNKGDEARLELGERGTATCREDRRRSVVEAAKLSGAEVWATGNEPGWTLRIFPERMVLVTDHGQRTIVTPRPEPVQSADGGAITYRAETEAHRVSVVLRDETCRDSMSGEEYDTTVEVTLDGERYRGCGLLLTG